MASATGSVDKGLKCRDVMSTRLITVAPHESIINAIELLHSNKIRHIPVVEDERVIGMISDRDTRQVLAILQVMGITLEQARGDLKVSEFMASPVKTVKPDMKAVDVARLLIENKIGSLPVIEEDKIIGIVTETDIMKQFVSDYS